LSVERERFGGKKERPDREPEFGKSAKDKGGNFVSGVLRKEPGTE